MTNGQLQELHRELVVRDLLSAARHALDLHDESDAVTFKCTLDKDGLQLDVTHLQRGQPVSGWGQ